MVRNPPPVAEGPPAPPANCALRVPSCWTPYGRDLTRVVCIEKDLDLILAVDIVAVCVRRAHDVAVYLTRANPEVDRVGRVPHQNLGGLVGRTTIDRLILRKTGEPSGSAPYGLVEVAIDAGDRIDSRNIDMRAVRAPTVHKR
jgi:hypothetical protein